MKGRKWSRERAPREQEEPTKKIDAKWDIKFSKWFWTKLINIHPHFEQKEKKKKLT